MKDRQFLAEKPRFLCMLLGGLVAVALFICSFVRMSDDSLICDLARSGLRVVADSSATPIQLQAVLHYATSRVVPQQNMAEIRISFDVLRKAAPCNFLVYGLGHDSLMWASFNPGGTTVFLEEDPSWVQTVLKGAPGLQAHRVKYPTQLSQANDLLSAWRREPSCHPSAAYLRGNTRCPLALTTLPEEVYDKEWDLIMIDAPRGYFNEAPGRMGAIFSAAVMARNRKGPGPTHVFLHDVDRRVEKAYAEEFLCRKYLVNSAGRLWHFIIPSAVNATGRGGDTFC